MTLGNNQRGIVAIGLVVLLVLAGCAGGGGGGGARSAGGGGDGGGAAAAGGADGPTTVGSYYVDGERVVVRKASMDVRVSEFDPAFDRARAVVREQGGYVADWELDVDDGWHRATLDVKVPAENFSAARDAFADLGTVERERVDAQDFTAEHGDLEDRLADLRDREAALEADLAATDDARLSRDLRRDLKDVRAEIRSIEDDRRTLERRAGLSTITLTLQEPESSRRPSTYRSALGVQLSVLTAFFAGMTVVKYVLAVVGFAVPIGLTAVAVSAAGLVSVRLTRRTWSGFDDALRAYGLDSVRGGDDPDDGEANE